MRTMQVIANKTAVGLGSFEYSFALLKSGNAIAQASGGDCNIMEITADQVGAQLLEAALNTLTGMGAHILENKYILGTNN